LSDLASGGGLEEGSPQAASDVAALAGFDPGYTVKAKKLIILKLPLN
jgi:hypothetical protein